MIFTPASLRWLETILEERYGLKLTLRKEGQELTLALPGAEGRIRFDTLQPEFHQSRSDFPCGSWDATKEGFIPILGEPLPTPAVADVPARMVEQDGHENVFIHYDILGLTYWMLTRLEEVDRTDLDYHQRFPATSSHAYQHGYLERPIIDEWLDLLGQVIRKQWPGVEPKQHQFNIKVSHDVDAISLYSFKPWKTIARMVAGHALKRRDLKACLQAPLIKLTTGKQLHSKDPYNTFDWLMDVSEKHGLASAFYFICGLTSSKDADYEPEHPLIQELMQRIHQRGHEIGLHPSYGTYQKPELIKQEAERLRVACAKAGVSQTRFGGRMHYLRWEQPRTLQAWEDAGMSYDTTLCYADRPGFRCGTCFEYQAYNPQTQLTLKLRIRPLVAMECSIIAKRYMNLGYTEATSSKFLELKEKCRKVNGCFTLLWHNSHFCNRDDFMLYEEVLTG